MSPADFVRWAVTPALEILGPEFVDNRAVRQVVAQCWQESGLIARKQYRNGPAMGFGQIEPAGLRALMANKVTRPHLLRVCQRLSIKPEIKRMLDAAIGSDIFTAAAHRLFLRAVPNPLPEGIAEGWKQYLVGINPGRPRPERWTDAWRIGEEAAYS